MMIAISSYVWWRLEAATFGPPRQRLIAELPGFFGGASFSPDAAKIAFVKVVDGVPQIWVKDLDTGDLVRSRSAKPLQTAHGGRPETIKLFSRSEVGGVRRHPPRCDRNASGRLVHKGELLARSLILEATQTGLETEASSCLSEARKSGSRGLMVVNSAKSRDFRLQTTSLLHECPLFHQMDLGLYFFNPMPDTTEISG